jgi:lipoprotein-anchoring transpeptidase ErfK/SrfK
MKRPLFVAGISLVALILNFQPAQAAHNLGEEPVPDGAPLCMPTRYPLTNVTCLPLGPVHYRARMAELGITFPLQRLPANSPDNELSAVPYLYAQVVKDNAPVFASLEAAVKGDPVLRRIKPGFDYVTYIDAAEVDGKRYYMIDQGVWMRGADLSRISATSSFQGLAFRSTPKVQFGWILAETEARRTPGYYPENFNADVFYRYQIARIYDVKEVDGVEWNLLGPEQWVEGRFVGRVTPNTEPPDGVENGRWIEVNLAEQTLAVYDQERLVFATLVASGLPGSWTQPGLFQIYKKVEAETMEGAFTADHSDYYYLEDVPWTMYFDQARALHGTYWHNRFGYPQSRGCVNLSPGDSNWLFSWAQEGDWVYVWDPTGQTPTDPSLYNAGGA